MKLKPRVYRFLLSKISKKKAKYYLDFFFFAIGFFVSSLLALFISVNVNSELSKPELGKLSYNKSALELCAYILTLTIYRSYLRFNVNGLSAVLHHYVNIVCKVALVILAIVAVFFTGSIITILFAFFVLFEQKLYLNRSLMAVKRLNLLKIGAAGVTLIAILIFSNYYTLTSDYVLFAYGLGFLVAVFFSSKSFKRHDDSAVLNLKTVLLFSFPALGAILVKLSLDVSAQFLLKEFFDFEEVSKFAIALRVLLSVKLFSSLFMMFYPPIYFREIQNKNGSFIEKIRLSLIGLMLIVSVLAYIFAHQIYQLMGAYEYLEYVNIFRLLIIAEFVFVSGSLYSTYLSYALKPHVSLIIYAIGAIVNVTLLFLFLKSKGIEFAAYSVLISNICIVVAQFFTAVRWERHYLQQDSSTE
jgi:O-antigen/teichoic acid export membrane protein